MFVLNTSWPVETSHGSEAPAWYYRGYITAHLTDPESFLPVHAGMNTQTHNVTSVYGVLSTKERPTLCTHSILKESETGRCGSKPNSVIMRGSVCTRCVRGAAAGIQSEMYENDDEWIQIHPRLGGGCASICQCPRECDHITAHSSASREIRMAEGLGSVPAAQQSGINRPGKDGRGTACTGQQQLHTVRHAGCFVVGLNRSLYPGTKSWMRS